MAGCGHTALTMAAAKGEWTENADGQTVLAVELLLDIDPTKEQPRPNVNSETSVGDTALTWAARFGRLEVMEALLERGARVDQVSVAASRTALQAAARNGRLEA